MSKKSLIAVLSTAVLIGGVTGVCFGVPQIRESIKASISNINDNNKNDTSNDKNNDSSVSKEDYEKLLSENTELKTENGILKQDNNNLSNGLLESNNALLQRDESISGLLSDKENLQNQLDNALNGDVELTAPDKLKIEKYNGTWYKNGTFEDYYTIKDGVVTKNANVDRGILQVMFGQMYLIFNSGDMIPITLSDNGRSFLTDNDVKYTNTYITFAENVKPQMGYIIGSYNNITETIDLYSDNIIRCVKGNVTLYGAYSVNAVRKNIGGNFTYVQKVYATINKTDDTSITRTFNIINNGDLVEDTGVVYKSTFKENTIVSVDDEYKTDCLKYTINFTRPVDVNSLKAQGATNLKIQVPFLFSTYYKPVYYLNGVASSEYSSAGGNGYYHYVYIPLDDCSDSLDTFTFYLKTNYQTNAYIRSATSLSFNFCDDNKTSIKYVSDYKIVDFEIIGSPVYNPQKYVSDDVLSLYNTTFYKVCTPVNSWVNGTYETENDTTITILDDIVTISTSETINDSVVNSDTPADSITITAKTDGTDIIQSVTIKYTLNGSSHTITFDITNNTKTITNSKIDNVVKTITKV